MHKYIIHKHVAKKARQATRSGHDQIETKAVEQTTQVLHKGLDGKA